MDPFTAAVLEKGITFALLVLVCKFLAQALKAQYEGRIKDQEERINALEEHTKECNLDRVDLRKRCSDLQESHVVLQSQVIDRLTKIVEKFPVAQGDVQGDGCE